MFTRKDGVGKTSLAAATGVHRPFAESSTRRNFIVLIILYDPGGPDLCVFPHPCRGGRDFLARMGFQHNTAVKAMVDTVKIWQATLKDLPRSCANGVRWQRRWMALTR